MTTLKDVAIEAGVSISTASRALSGTGRISRDTIDNVNQAAARLNYSANIHARSLKMGKSQTIALLVPDIRNPIYPLIAKAAEKKARENGYTVYLCNSDESPTVEHKYIKSLTQHNIDGLIVASTSEDITTLLDTIDIPYVILIREIEGVHSSVSVDNYMCGKLAIKHLINMKCKDIILVSPPSTLSLYKERIKACENIGKENDISCRCEYLDAENPDWSAIDSLSYDGIIALNDVLGFIVLGHLYRNKKRVPDDIKVISIDGLPMGNYSSPPMTSIQQPYGEIGSRAVEMLIDKIEGKSEGKNILLDVSLNIRESS